MKLLVRLIINAVGLVAAARFVDGIALTDSIGGILIVALIFGVVNALIRPILTVLSIPFILITMGLFTLVINAVMLSITSGLSGNLAVDGFGSAFWGAIVISIVSWLLGALLPDEDEKAQRTQRH